MSEPTAFRTEALSFRYPAATRDALRDINISVRAGEFYAVIGPNGSGKSTLARVLLGVLPPASGRALFQERDARAWERRSFARQVGVVPQGEDIVFPITTRALVAMGRYPHQGAWSAETQVDSAAIAEAMTACDVMDLGDRLVTQLSGGERQRVRIARALAQQPSALVLDEPTAALDLAHEMAIFELLARLRSERGVTVLLVTHNINLAARYADRLLLLDHGEAVAEGAAVDVVTRALVERSYQWPVTVFKHLGPGPDQGAPQVTPLGERI